MSPLLTQLLCQGMQILLPPLQNNWWAPTSENLNPHACVSRSSHNHIVSKYNTDSFIQADPQMKNVWFGGQTLYSSQRNYADTTDAEEIGQMLDKLPWSWLKTANCSKDTLPPGLQWKAISAHQTWLFQGLENLSGLQTILHPLRHEL